MTLHFSLYEDAATIKKPVEHLSPPSVFQKFYRSYIKRCMDIVLTLVSAPVALPLIGFAALLIALDGHNPFYSQRRVGKDGREFRIWKLRTMVHQADALLETYLNANPDARQEWDKTQKLKRDPRITKIGKLLRKISLDELPQLWNVFNGTMSLVGPRPMMICQRDVYHGTSYYNLRPGITGLWQISKRNESSFLERVSYDDAYDRTISMKTDLSVLMGTVTVVLRGTGY